MFDIYLTYAGQRQPILLTLDLRAELVPVDRPFTPAATLLTGFAADAPAVAVLEQATEVFGPALLVGPAAVVDVSLPGGRAAAGREVIVSAGRGRRWSDWAAATPRTATRSRR